MLSSSYFVNWACPPAGDASQPDTALVQHHCLKYGKSVKAVNSTYAVKSLLHRTFVATAVACTGLPSTDNLRFYQNFVVSFDSAKRNAKWVLEHITKESSSGQGSR